MIVKLLKKKTENNNYYKDIYNFHRIFKVKNTLIIIKEQISQKIKYYENN